MIWYSSVCCCSVARSWPTLSDTTDCSIPGSPVLNCPGACPNSCPLSQWCHPTIYCPIFLLPSMFPSIRVFSSGSVLHIRWPKYWSFSFSVSLPNEYSGMISFKINWFDLAVQRTLKSLLQYHSSKASSILWCSAFLWSNSHPYMNYWKNYSFDYGSSLVQH